MPHSSSDNHNKYRTDEELEKDKQIDPIARLELSLIEAGILTTQEIEKLRKEVHVQIDEEAKWAEQQADPSPDTALKHVFFEGDIGLEYEKSTPSGEPVVVVDAINHERPRRTTHQGAGVPHCKRRP